MPTRRLPVQLTDDELRMKGSTLASELEHLAAVKSAGKYAARQFKEKQLALEIEISILKNVILQKCEMREVEIIEHKDWLEKTVSTVRPDTGEVIETRPMTMEERNRPLPFEPEEAGEASA